MLRNQKHILPHPLFFVRGGYISTDGQRLSSAGQWGVYWSSRADSNTGYAYRLYFDTNGVNPSDYSYHYRGYSLRCLIPTP